AVGAQHPEPVDLRHLDVEKDQVRRERAKGPQRLPAVAAFANDNHVGVRRQQLANAAPSQWLIVGDDGPNVRHGRTTPAASWAPRTRSEYGRGDGPLRAYLPREPVPTTRSQRCRTWSSGAREYS